jgi:putative SOS response-associated peptidase YedK
MCGRFALSKLPAELLEEFEIHTGESLARLPLLPADWNITPTREIYLVRNNSDNQRELATASWGMIAGWSKDRESALRSQSQAINARSESVAEKPTFRSAFRNRRCLIPADGYYEWATELGPYSPKQPFYISSDEWESSRRSLAFAGIWDRWIAPDGQIVDSASIITRPAVGFLATVHSRMPTFLPLDRWDSWLDRSIQDPSEITAMMAFNQSHEPDRGLRAVPVSSMVNSIRNNGPELITPIELGEPETLF